MDKAHLIATVAAAGKAFGFALYMELERRLGKTRHGSLLGLVFSLLSDILLRRRQEKPTTNTPTATFAWQGALAVNELMKPVVKMLVDIAEAVQAGIKKDWNMVLKESIEGGMNIPEIVKNWEKLVPELESLVKHPEANADLLAYASGLVAGQDAKAKAIIIASADLLLTGSLKVGKLIEAINMPEPSAAPQA